MCTRELESKYRNTRRVRKVRTHHVWADREIFYADYGNTAADLDPLSVSRVRLTMVEPALSETCLKWQRRSRVPPNANVWRYAYGAIAVTVAWIQECGENPMFHLQSQWSPETHLLPGHSA
jgi:hypothetical protein